MVSDFDISNLFSELYNSCGRKTCKVLRYTKSGESKFGGSSGTSTLIVDNNEYPIVIVTLNPSNVARFVGYLGTNAQDLLDRKYEDRYMEYRYVIVRGIQLHENDLIQIAGETDTQYKVCVTHHSYSQLGNYTTSCMAMRI